MKSSLRFHASILTLACLLLATVATASRTSVRAQQQASQQASPQQAPSQQNRPAASPSSPQQQSPAAATAAQEQEGREVVNIPLVRLPLTVVDRKGQPVSGLTAGDFLVFEDKQPQRIESFVGERESQPLYIGVLMDTSSSTAGKLRFEQEAASNFIHTVARLRKDQIAFVTFDDEIKLLQDFTTKLDLLDEAIDGVKKPGKQTSLYDAVWQFCDEKLRGVQGRRALVLITDGEDTYSRARLSDAIDIALLTETSIYAISTKAGFSGTVPGVEAGTVSDRGDRDLEKLCEDTGGRALFTGDVLALERAFKRIASELRGQYTITYRPTNDRYDGSFRRVEVQLARERDKMKVRTKRGYRAVR